MMELAEIRRRNLRSLQKSPRELSDQLGRVYTYWRDLLADGSTKSFGEKVARDIEIKLELPPHWLDSEHGREETVKPQPSSLEASLEAVLAALDGRSAYRAEQIADALVRFATGRASKAEVTADLLQWLTEPRGRESGADAHTSAPPRRRAA